MFIIIVVVFVLGYTAIALEHPLKVDKAASALLVGVLCWAIYILSADAILSLGHSPNWNPEVGENIRSFVGGELNFHLIDIAQILFFLMGAMTIVEIIDQHNGFKIITDKITTTNKVKLLWIISFLSFFMSAALDNLTSTIVMVALLRKLIEDKPTRWFYASMVVLAANAGGAWSPIGDVTTIMLWIGGQVTTIAIITRVILPSLVAMIAPLIIVSFMMKGNVTRPEAHEDDTAGILTTRSEQLKVLIIGVLALLFVPVFKTITDLPPYMGMLFGLSILWIFTEIMHRGKREEIKKQLSVFNIIRRIDTPTILFFLGILTAVSALQSAGHLNLLANWLDNNLGNIYLINLAIGLLSAIVDNVPLVAGAMGMYPIETAEAVGYAANFVQDGLFWELLAYCAGTGGSILIIGSAAGIAAMGLERIDFIWYLKKISWLALVGYFAGAGVYYLQSILFLHP
ncbi:MAG: sodium:proton antiporter [Bacteroidales bacterium]|nr:sodium:proton antiporter [Bacteroidales bacterium]